MSALLIHTTCMEGYMVYRRIHLLQPVARHLALSTDRDPALSAQ